MYRTEGRAAAISCCSDGLIGAQPEQDDQDVETNRQTNKSSVHLFFVLCRLPIDMWTAVHAKKQFPTCSTSLVKIDQLRAVGLLYLIKGLSLP